MREDGFEERLSAAERRIEEVAEDAAAARHLAAAGDRDLADLTARVLATQQAIDGVGVRLTGLEGRMTCLEGRMDSLDGRMDHLSGRVTRLEGRVDANTAEIKANTAAINNLSVQTGERFAQVDRRFVALETKVDNGFADVRGGLDRTGAGLDLIVKLLTPGEGPTQG